MILLISVGCGQEQEKEAVRQKPTADVKAKKPAPTEKAVSTSADPAAGKLVYLKHCHYCHGREGRGDGPVAMQVEPKPINFVTDRKKMSVSDDELLQSIRDGINKETGGFGEKFEKALLMPPFKGILTEKEIIDVLAYVRVLEKEGRAKDASRK